MARYQIILAYDGTDFSGFQRQARGRQSRTVQGEFEAAIRRIGWRGERILAAGRTDAGVHAAGQVVSFDLEWNHGDVDLLAAINAFLPRDMAVRHVKQVDPDFHPRHDALARSYCYRIFYQPVRDPLRERYAWRVWPQADFDRLCAAAALLVGKHDFRAFGTPSYSGGSTVRQVKEATWLRQMDEVVFHITGNAFLYRMIRKLVAFQLKIGQRSFGIEALTRCLQTGDKDLIKNIAPACGLNLVCVHYQ